MTIANDGSAESGWYYDGDFKNATLWRFGTERPCSLVGEYVTIVADYSSEAPPYEKSICTFGVMGTFCDEAGTSCPEQETCADEEQETNVT